MFDHMGMSNSRLSEDWIQIQRNWCIHITAGMFQFHDSSNVSTSTLPNTIHSAMCANESYINSSVLEELLAS